jgi:RimJ/RimL family protein N-acetyltransferase
MMEEAERFETDPVIDCGEVVLRRFRMDDIDDIVTNINDRGVSRYTLNIPYPYGPEDAIEFLEKNERSFDEGKSLNLAITEKSTDRVIGGIGLMNIEWTNRAADIGYWLGRSYWGRGLVPQAVKGFVDYIFKFLGLHRLSAVIFGPNLQSRRVMEKCGFLMEGTMRERYLLDGELVDGVIFSRLSHE